MKKPSGLLVFLGLEIFWVVFAFLYFALSAALKITIMLGLIALIALIFLYSRSKSRASAGP